ncbi:MAG: hypothetical protein R2856_00135 [Caldilineaceae bacterium]
MVTPTASMLTAMRAHQRSMFVVDQNDVVRYTEVHSRNRLTSQLRRRTGCGAFLLA